MVSVMRVSQLNFEKLLLGHQDEPILENAQKNYVTFVRGIGL
jgi:hypothetical protein